MTEIPTELRLSPGAPAAPPVPPRRGPQEPAVKRGRRRFSVVWLVPLVAAAIAIWLAVTTLREQGPTVTITFETAEGLEAGKTKVRYKDVEVGTVQDVRLSDDLKDVVAVAELRKQVEPFMTEGTRCWVVRPRVGASGVSGLGTLISGAYIGLDPGQGKHALSFTGLEEPPPMTSDVPGRRFSLHADNLGSVEQGSPVYYRGLRVGQVLGRTLDENRRSFTFTVFVDAPNDQLVRDTSRFWNASGIDVSVGANGVERRDQIAAEHPRRRGRVRHARHRGARRGGGGRPRVPPVREPAQGRRAGHHREGAVPGRVQRLGRRPPRRQPGRSSTASRSASSPTSGSSTTRRARGSGSRSRSTSSRSASRSKAGRRRASPTWACATWWPRACGRSSSPATC